MFEKLMQAAEQAATGVSRRQFFGRFARAAMAAAAVLGGAAAMAREAQAGDGNRCPAGTHLVKCPNFARPLCCPPGKTCRCNHIACYCV